MMLNELIPQIESFNLTFMLNKGDVQHKGQKSEKLLSIPPPQLGDTETLPKQIFSQPNVKQKRTFSA